MREIKNGALRNNGFIGILLRRISIQKNKKSSITKKWKGQKPNLKLNKTRVWDEEQSAKLCEKPWIYQVLLLEQLQAYKMP